jgi:DNA-binding NarL/FixJ family response regulator
MVEAIVEKRRLLIVEDDPSCERALDLMTRTWFDPVIVPSVRQAFAVLESGPPPAAAIVDLMLPDGSGFEVLEALRKSTSELPVLVLTACHDPVVVNRVHTLRAELVCKPFLRENLVQFAQRVVNSRPPALQARLTSVVADVAREYHLSARESQILGLAVDGVPRRHLARTLGVSENTIKTQVRSLLDKLGQVVLSDAVWWIRSRAGQ